MQMIQPNHGADAKKQLAELLARIALGIDKQFISREMDIEEFVRIVPDSVRGKQELHGGTIKPTLLEILGYSDENCEDHNTKKVGHTNFIPDYVCGTGQKTWMVLDLKAPDVSLDGPKNGPKMGDFIQSYCHTLNPPAPIGVLYNGYSLRVFINPRYPGFERFLKLSEEQDKAKAINFYHTPVASADANRPAEMIKILLLLSASSLSGNAVTVAKRFANARIKENDDKIVAKKIQEILNAVLLNPSEDIIAALAGIDSLWEEFTPRPTQDKILSAWGIFVAAELVREEKPVTIASVESTAKQSINGLLRQKVADVYSTKGEQLLTPIAVRGLRSRHHGGNGYHLVPQGPGIPPNLYVAGVATVEAKRIIQDLDKIMAS
jgi:hypothetical protein